VDILLEGSAEFIILGDVDESKVGDDVQASLELLGIDVFDLFGGFTVPLFGLFVSRNDPFGFTFTVGVGYLLVTVFAFGALTL